MPISKRVLPSELLILYRAATVPPVESELRKRTYPATNARDAAENALR